MSYPGILWILVCPCRYILYWLFLLVHLSGPTYLTGCRTGWTCSHRGPPGRRAEGPSRSLKAAACAQGAVVLVPVPVLVLVLVLGSLLVLGAGLGVGQGLLLVWW